MSPRFRTEICQGFIGSRVDRTPLANEETLPLYENYASLFGRVVAIIFKILIASVDFGPFISELGSNILAKKGPPR